MKKLNSLPLILSLFTVSFEANADFKLLLKEMISINYEWKNIDAKNQAVEFQYQSVLNKRTWYLNFYNSFEDSSLESTLGVVSPAKTLTSAISLSRENIKGGEFTFKTSFSKVENNSTLFGLNSDVKGFAQSIIYEQDLSKNFFGAQSKLDLEKADLIATRDYIDLEREKEVLIVKLFDIYSKALWKKNSLKLQENAFKRSVDRTKLINKKVRDGLREKVDLLQAKTAQIKQEEILNQAEVELQNELDILSTMLNRRVDRKEIVSFEIPEFKNKNLENNKQIKSTQLNVKALSHSMKASRLAKRPDIKLNLEYNTNDYDGEFGESVSSGNILDGNEEFIASVNISIPLDNSLLKNDYQLKQINHSVELIKLNKLFMDNYLNERSLFQKLDQVNKNVSLAQKRIELTESTLREYNRLYARGRTDLDQIISAEESLIQTQKSYENYKYERKNIKAKLLALYGELDSSLIQGL